MTLAPGTADTGPTRNRRLAPSARATRADWVRAHPLTTYVTLAYTFSWTLWTPGLLGTGGAVGTVLLWAGGFGPAAAAALVLRWTGGSLREWLRPLGHWRVPVRYYVYALCLPAAIFLCVNGVLAALGEQVVFERLGPVGLSYLGVFLAVAFVGGGQEEPGWRGFALSRLQASHSPLAATALLGLIWGLWHLPLYGIGFIGPMLYVVFYTWLYNRTGSLLLCVLLHASFTPSLDHLVLVTDSPLVDAVIAGVLLVAAAGLIVLTRGRLGFDTRPAAPAGIPPASSSP